MKRSFPLVPFSVGRPLSLARCRGGIRRPETRRTALFTRHLVAGFTLVELMIVVALVAALAGLTIATLGYVNKRGAESRARAEVAAIAAAIEDYRRDVGRYPEVNDLVAELTTKTGKVYFEVLPRHTNASGQLTDPWGDPYVYATNPTQIENRGFFDFYSRAGGQTDESKWIRN